MIQKDRNKFFTPTSGLLIVNIMAYTYTSIVGRNFVSTNYRILMLYGQANYFVMNGWYWQLFTSLFIHVNILHLVSNMLFLMMFGLRAEDLFSSTTYLGTYLASGILGNLLSLLLGPYVVSAGASGAIFGLFGLCTAYLGRSFGKTFTTALIYSLYLLFMTAGAGVNILAHLGGLVAGLLIGYVLGRRRELYPGGNDALVDPKSAEWH